MKISSVLKEHSKILSENALRWQPKILLCDYTRHFGRVFSATCQIVTQKTFISTLPQGIEDGGRPVFVVVKKCGGRKYLSLFPITTIIWIYLELHQWWWYVPVTWSWYRDSSQTSSTSWEHWIWRSSLFKLDIIL